MEVEFTLVPEDFAALQQLHERAKPKGELARARIYRTSERWPGTTPWGLLICLLILAALVAYVPFARGGTSLAYTIAQSSVRSAGCWIGVGSGALLVVGGTILVRLANMHAYKKLCNDPRSRWMVGPRRLRIGPEGVSIIDEQYREFFSWPIIWFIAASKDHIFLYKSFAEAEIDPRRAFPDPTAVEAFLTLAQRYREEHPLMKRPRPTGSTTAASVFPRDHP